MMLLQNILLIILLFATLFFNKANSSSTYDTVTCSTQNDTPIYILKANTFTFFQSPNFPKSLAAGSLCNAQFKTSNESIFIWVALINGAAGNIAFSDDNFSLHKLNAENYDSNFDIVTYETWSNSFTVQVNATSSSQQQQNTWSAFQAALVTFSDGTDYSQCPFSAQTFDFAANPVITVPIANNYAASTSDYENKTCQWIFTLASSQQLKIVVKNIEIADEVQLTLYGNGETVVKNFTTEDNSQVYYLTGTFFNLIYDYKFANTSDIKFFILISAVTPSTTFSTQGCQNSQVNATTGTTIFTNIDYNVGYPPYQKCENSINIPEGYEGTFAITEAYYESCCDKLFVNYGTNQTQLITWQNKQQPIQYILTHDISGIQNNLIFISDGNTEGAGFVAELQLYECNCANLNFRIQCNTTAIYYPMENSYTYCSNQDCIYMIAQNFDCPDTYLHMVVVNSLRKNSSADYILLRENGDIQQNMTADTGALDLYYSLKNSITLQFHSGAAFAPVVPENKFWFVYLTSVPSPNFLPKITLNVETKTKHILWLPDDMTSNNALTVCTETGILELFVTSDNYNRESGFLLYDSDDLNYFIGDLNQIPKSDPSLSSIPSSIKSTSGCFTIFLSSFSSYNNGHAVMFRIADENNCQSTNTVFQVTYDSAYDVTVTSGDLGGTCEMIILALTGFPNEIPHIWLNNITTTNSSSGQFTFLSLVNNKTLFDFDGEEASEWQSIGIYTLALSILIPPSSEITIHLSSNDQITEYINVVESGIQKGIMASPSYCGIMQTFATTQIYQVTGPVSFAIDFIVKDLYGNPNPVIQNYPNNHTLLQNNTTLIVYNFQVYYAETDPENNGFLVEYTIQGNVPLPDEETSSSQPLTMETTAKTGTVSNETTITTTPFSKPTITTALISSTSTIPSSTQTFTNTTTSTPTEQPTTVTTQAYITYSPSSSERHLKNGILTLFIYILAFFIIF